jgi:hypothetical protein
MSSPQLESVYLLGFLDAVCEAASEKARDTEAMAERCYDSHAFRD